MAENPQKAWCIDEDTPDDRFIEICKELLEFENPVGLKVLLAESVARLERSNDIAGRKSWVH